MTYLARRTRDHWLVRPFLSMTLAAVVALPGVASAKTSAFEADDATLQHWTFESPSGGALKDSASQARAALSGGHEPVKGKFGQAIQFNGIDGRATLQAGRNLEIGADQPVTVEAVVKVINHGKTQQIVCGGAYFELEVRGETGAVSFNLRSADDATSVRCTGKRSITDGRWHYVAGVRDPKSKTVRLYIDGQLDAEVADTTAGHKLVIPDGTAVGASPAGAEPLGGAIDELRISSTARPIKALFGAAADPDAKAEQQVLENEKVRLTFEVIGSSVYLASLLDKTSNVEFIQPGRAENIWHASLKSKNAATVLDEQEGKLEVKRSPEEIRFTWSELSIADQPNQATVVATVSLPKDAAMSDWRIEIDNRSDEFGLWTARFPRISNLAKLSNDGKDFLAIPGGNGGGAGEGMLYPDPFKTMTHTFVRTYPCYHQSMQFNAYYNDQAGLYLATHDGKMNLKGFLLQPQTGEQPTMLYELYHYPADSGVAGTDLKQEYPALIGTFDGDWYDACQIYREWALEQVWASAGPLEQRKDISPWIKNGAYWMVGTFEWEPTDQPHMRKLARTLPIEEARKRVRTIDVEKSMAMVREARDFFGFPLLLWTNEWFDGGGDISPPRYMPMKKLDQYMKQIHEEYDDVYVSGHMQMKRYSVQLAEYDQTVEQALEFTPDGKLAIEPMDAMDKGDQIAYPCWYTPFWKSFWDNKAKEIVSATGLDGFHVDELGSATMFEHQCFRPDHGHPIGGGTLYADTRRNNITMLRDATRTVNPNFAIHHEALSEIYIDRVDLAEVCTAPSQHNKPMYEAVYHDYVFLMGRRIHPWMDRRTFPMGDPKYGDNDIDQFVSSFAQTFIWGNQPGWTRLDIVQYSPKVAQIIKDFMNVRYRNMKFLNTGRYIRPLTVTKALPTKTNTWTTCDTPEVTLPVVLNSVWKASDGTVGLVLANITDQPQEISYRYNLAEQSPNVNRWQLARTDGESPQVIDTISGTVLERTETVAPRSAMVLQLTPQK